MPPNTSVPVPAQLSSASCDKCEPGDDLLIGPTRAVLESANFTVTGAPVVLRAFGLKVTPGAVVTVQQHMNLCGETLYEDVCEAGVNQTLDAATNTLALKTSGTYRVVLTGAEPDDIWVVKTTDVAALCCS